MTASGWVAENPDPDTRLWRARCECGWTADPRPDTVAAWTDLLTHRADAHGEPV